MTEHCGEQRWFDPSDPAPCCTLPKGHDGLHNLGGPQRTFSNGDNWRALLRVAKQMEDPEDFIKFLDLPGACSLADVERLAKETP